jgi:hypothetical protein
MSTSVSLTARGLVVAVLTLAASADCVGAQSRPAAKCTGQNDCGTGDYLCTAIDEGALHGPITFDDRGRSIRSDGRPYHEAKDANVRETATHGAVLLKLEPDSSPNPRFYTVDLNHPVPGSGSKPLGVIQERGSDGQAWIAAQWETIDRVMKMPRAMTIGSTVKSKALIVTLHIDGRPYTLQAGPLPDFHCFSGPNKIHGRGTSEATIHRQSADTWIVDLPEGSIARLFDISGTAAEAVDLGLYYVSIRYTLVVDP